jgi:DNA (cytosine-5)-methyltransferase 1
VVICTDDGGTLAGISLCAGYGGLDLGIAIAEPRYRAVCYVEREAHAAATLVARMADEALDQAPVWDDLKSFDGHAWRGRVHILSAGYPCQPFSHSGKRQGSADPRHLWPDVARIIDESDPQIVFLENVEGHIDLGFAEVAGELRRLGYEPKAGLFTARETGASHRRRRLFIMAHANRDRRGLYAGPDAVGRIGAAKVALRHRTEQLRSIFPFQRGTGMDTALADHAADGLAIGDDVASYYELPLFAPAPGELQDWERLLDRRPDLQPAIFRDDYGMADRVDRTRAAGNGVCALEAAFAYCTLAAAFEREWRQG